MMIKKIIKVKNIGRLADCTPAGDVELRKLTLVYSENGRGKTTLSAILRSLKTGESKYIEERRTLGQAGPPEAYIRLGFGNATYKNGTWSATLPQLAIFDSDFIENNVYSGRHVHHEHKKNLCTFAIGERGVQIARRIEAIDRESREKRKEGRRLEEQIKDRILGDMRADTFIGLSPDNQIERKIAAQKQKVARLEKASEISSKPALSELPAPEDPTGPTEKLLRKTLEDVARDAEERVKQQVQQCMDRDGEAWLSKGLHYVKDEACPFCGQSVKGNELVSAYRDYFRESYQDFKEEIKRAQKTLSEQLSEFALRKIGKTVQNNKELARFWGGLKIASYFPTLDFEGIQDACDELGPQVRAHLSQKAQTPLEVVEVAEAFTNAKAEYWRVCGLIGDYNGHVRKVNGLIEAEKQRTASGNLAEEKNRLARLENIKVRYNPHLDTLCTNYRRVMADWKSLQTEKQRKEEELRALTQKMLPGYEGEINALLDRFGADFRICKMQGSYAGGRASSNYCLKINGESIELGDPNSWDGTPSFRNTLSAGDKGTLAFAFFLARLEKEPDAAGKIVVFDDPICSLDRQRKAQTRCEVLRVLSRVNQVVVMSHDPYFLQQFWGESDKSRTKTLWIFREGVNNSNLGLWDIEQATQSHYFQNYFALSKYLEEGTQDDLRSTARRIRPLLEANLRMRFPPKFKANEWLGDFIKKIRGARPGDKLAGWKEHLQELEDINTFSKEYHHDTNPGQAEKAPIDDSTLRAFARRTLDLISV
ncbi:MAG TPA: AAA family ATPase [Phycisphaerae bacterium]|nr:AAA family ATPase [Phycisphaerae bacterium]